MYHKLRIVVDGGEYVVNFETTVQMCKTVMKATKEQKSSEIIHLMQIKDSITFQKLMKLVEGLPCDIKESELFEILYLSEQLDAIKFTKHFTQLITQKFSLDKILEGFVKQLITSKKSKSLIEILAYNFPKLIERKSLQYLQPSVLLEIFTNENFARPNAEQLNQFICRTYDVYKENSFVLRGFVTPELIKDEKYKALMPQNNNPYLENSTQYKQALKDANLTKTKAEIEQEMKTNTTEIVSLFNKCKSGEIQSKIFQEATSGDMFISPEKLNEKLEKLEKEEIDMETLVKQTEHARAEIEKVNKQIKDIDAQLAK